MNESESCKSRDAHMMAPNNVVIFTSKEILTYAQELYKNTLVGFRSSETEMPWEELIWIGSKLPFSLKNGSSKPNSRVGLR